MIAGDVLQFPDLVAVFGGFGVHLKHSDGQLTGVCIQSRSVLLCPVQLHLSRYYSADGLVPNKTIHIAMLHDS